jgi:hypothetical protein
MNPVVRLRLPLFVASSRLPSLVHLEQPLCSA